MHETPRARRFSGAPVALLALTLVAFPAAAQPDSNYEVVLKDGTSVTATTRPLIAMGKVSFLGADNRSMTLPVQSVNVDATRERLGSSSPRSHTWTDRSLAKVKGSIQVVGESEAPVAAEGGASSGDVKPASETELGDMTQAERIRYEISALNEKMKRYKMRPQRKKGEIEDEPSEIASQD